MHFRQEVRRRVFKALKDILAWEDIGFGTEADDEPDPATVEEPALVGVWLKGFGTEPEQIELLATLVVHGGRQKLVQKRFPEQACGGPSKEYQGLHRERTRLLEKVRAELSDRVFGFRVNPKRTPRGRQRARLDVQPTAS